MLFVGLALLSIAIIVLFFAPWVGIPAGIAGLIVLVLALLGVGRRAASPPSGATPSSEAPGDRGVAEEP